MATPTSKAPPGQTATITYKTGETAQYDIGSPRHLYDVNRLGVAGDDIDAGFFIVWVAAGKPGLNGHDLTIDNARPALEAWLDGVVSVDTQEVALDGPPTRQPKRSRGSRA